MKVIAAVLLSIITLGSSSQNETMLGNYYGKISRLKLAIIDHIVCLVYIMASVSAMISLTYIYGLKFLYVLPMSMIFGIACYMYLHILSLEKRLKNDKV